MRILSFIVLLLITILEIGPVPITGLILIGIVFFRPLWFYHWVIKIYGNKPSTLKNKGLKGFSK